MKDEIFAMLQKAGRAFMLPIAILPVAGMLMGVGESLTNQAMLEAYGMVDLLGPGTMAHAILVVCSKCGSAVFDNLPLLFAMGVALGFAKAEKAVATLSAAIAFIIMHTAINSMLVLHRSETILTQGSITSVLGIETLQMGVFGGIIVGIGVTFLHNRYYKIRFPEYLSFFAGTRFVPIISSIVFVFVGILMFHIWPPVQRVMYDAGQLVYRSGYLGTFFYGIMERVLIPFGLHHVFYLPFWQTSLGGIMEVGGKLVEGAQNIFFAQLSDPATQHFAVSATRFMAGKFPLMIFGLPGAALAIYECAKPERKKVVGGLLLSAALTSMLTGITEPLEFTFLFIAPGLYAIHCVFAGLAYMLMHILEICVGMTFSGGFIDMFLFGILQGQAKTNWMMFVPVGIGYFIVYYVMFTCLIKKFDLKTPGRESEEDAIKLYTRSDYQIKFGNKKELEGMETSSLITAGLGGKENVCELDCCATRLRCRLVDGSLIDEGILKQSGSRGIMVKGNIVQIIYGPLVAIIKSNLEEYLEDPISTKLEEEKKVYIEAENGEMEIASEIIMSPILGENIPLDEVPDDVFSAELLGEGFAVIPEEGKVYAPVDGTIYAVFETKHAIGFVSDRGAEVLVHVGIETVRLGGEYFNVFVEPGQHVEAGELVAEFDLISIQDRGYSVITPVVVSNTEEYTEIEVHLDKAEVLILKK